MSSVRRAVKLLPMVLLFTVLRLPTAEAADDPAVVARQAYDTGMAHFHLEEYDAAIQEWERGFRAKPVAEFLFNIAQAYRLSNRADKALSFYRKFLGMAPDAPNRLIVERHIETLKRELARAPIEPTKPVLHKPEPSTPDLIKPESTAPRVELIASPKRPVYKKGWFWGVMSGAAVVVVGAVVLGVVLGGQGSQPQLLKDVQF